MENPAEIERLVQEDIRRERLGERVQGQDIRVSVSKDESPLKPVLLLLGAFAFAFCLGEAVHELGHFLAHRAHGFEVAIILDPFGGSRTLGSSSPREIWGITTVAGPSLNLLTALPLFLFLWPKRRPAILPLLLWGPIALVQEGVTLSLGMLTPGGDAELIVEWGAPAGIILSLGILFLASGVVMVCWILPLVGLSPTDSFGRKFTVVSGGMVSFMVIRSLGAAFLSPNLTQENAVPLVFSLLLATTVAMLFSPVHSFFSRIVETKPVSVGWSTVLCSVALGAGMVLFQLASFN